MENLLNERISSAPGLAKVALEKDLDPIKEDIQAIKVSLGEGDTTLREKVELLEDDVNRLTGAVIDVQDDVILLERETIPAINERVDELGKSVSDGKIKVAAAITGKGIETAATDTFDVMANNIQNIQTGTDISDGNIVAEDIIEGKIGYSNEGRIVGTMPIITPETYALPVNGNYTIPKGYHDGTGRITQNINTITGTTHTLALNGTYNIPKGYHDGSGKVTQNITNRGAVNATLGINGTYTIPEGYHNGNGKVTQSIAVNTRSTRIDISNDMGTHTISGNTYYSNGYTVRANISNLIASNIKDGVNVGGVLGTYKGEEKSNENFSSNSSSYIQINLSGGSYTASYPITGWALWTMTTQGGIYFSCGGGIAIENFTYGRNHALPLDYVQSSVYTTQDIINRQPSCDYYLPLVKLSSDRKTISISFPNGYTAIDRDATWDFFRLKLTRAS